MKQLTILIASAALLLAGCSQQQANKYHGYIDANMTYIASPIAGKLKTLDVQRGEQVKSGKTLFALEKQPESAQFHAAAASLKQAEATLDNLLTGQRPSEIAAINAQIDQARAKLILANKQLKRYTLLAKTDNTSPAQYDTYLHNTRVRWHNLIN